MLRTSERGPPTLRDARVAIAAAESSKNVGDMVHVLVARWVDWVWNRNQQSVSAQDVT